MSSKYLYSKYLKYKTEYLSLKNEQFGGTLNKELSNANNNVSVKLFNLMDISKGNIFSPMSITFALSLLHLSAQGNTNKQLTELFNHKYTLDELESIYKMFNNEIMKITNALIINKKYKVNEKYLDSIKSLALIEHNNFSNTDVIVKKVNDYIEDNTNKMIKNILKQEDIDSSTIMVLINTVYFKANWLNEFSPESTHKMPFKGSKNMIDMMHQTNHFDYYEDNKLQLIEMLYKNEDYAMGTILPKNDVIPKLSGNELNKMISNFSNEKVELYFPKFKHKKNIQLVPLLQQLGISDLFNNKAKLDISKEAYVSKIIHEAVVIVDETGTEAAAATVVVMKQMMAMPTKSIIFKADRPFLYYIRHRKSNMILFYGNFNGQMSD